METTDDSFLSVKEAEPSQTPAPVSEAPGETKEETESADVAPEATEKPPVTTETATEEPAPEAVETPASEPAALEQSPAQEAAQVAEIPPQSAEAAPTAAQTTEAASPAPVVDETAVESPVAVVAEATPQTDGAQAGGSPVPAAEETPVPEAPREPVKPPVVSTGQSPATIKVEVTASEVAPAAQEASAEAVEPVVSWSASDVGVAAAEVTAEVAIAKNRTTPPSTPVDAPHTAGLKEKPEATPLSTEKPKVTPPPTEKPKVTPPPVDKPKAKVAPPPTEKAKDKVVPPPSKPKAKVAPPPAKPKAKVAPPPTEKPKAKAAPPPAEKPKPKAPPVVEETEETKTVTFAPGPPEVISETFIEMPDPIFVKAETLQTPVEAKVTTIRSVTPSAQPEVMRKIQKLQAKAQTQQPTEVGVRKVTRIVTEEKQPEVTEVRKVTKTTVQQPEVTEMRKVTRTVVEQPPEVTEVRRVTRTVTEQPEVSEVRRVTRTVTAQPEVSEVRRVTRTVTDQPEVSEVRRVTRTVTEQPEVSEVRRVTRTVTAQPEVSEVRTFTRTVSEQQPQVTEVRKVTRTMSSDQKPDVKTTTFRTVTTKAEPPEKVFKKITRVQQPTGPSRVKVRRTEFEAGPGDIETRKLKHRIITTTTTTTTEGGETTEDVQTRTEESTEVDEGKRVGKLTTYRIEGEHPVRRGEELQKDEATLREVRLKRLCARFEAGEQLTDEEKITMYRMIEEEKDSMPGPGVSWELRHKFEKGDVRNAELNIQREVATEVVRDSYGQLIPKFDRGEVHTAEPTYQGEKPEDVPKGVSTVFKRKFEKGDVRNAELLDFSEEAVVAMGAAKGLKGPFEVNADMVHNAEFNIQKEQCPLYDSNIEINREYYEEKAKEIEEVKVGRLNFEAEEQVVGTVYYKDRPYEVCRDLAGQLRMRFAQGNVSNIEIDEETRRRALEELELVREEREKAVFEEQTVGTVYWKDKPYEICRDTTGKLLMHFMEGDVHNAELRDVGKLEIKQEIEEVQKERASAQPLDQQVGTNYTPEKAPADIGKIKWSMQNKFKKGDVSNIEIDREYYVEKEKELEEVKVGRLNFEQVDQQVGTVYEKDVVPAAVKAVKKEASRKFKTGDVSNAELDVSSRMEALQELEEVRTERSQMEFEQQVVGSVYEKDVPPPECKVRRFVAEKFKKGDVSNIEINREIFEQKQKELEEVRVGRLSVEAEDQIVGARYDKEVIPSRIDTAKEARMKFLQGQVSNAELDDRTRQEALAELESVRSARLQMEEVRQEVGTRYDKDLPPPECSQVKKIVAAKFKEGDVHNAELDFRSRLEAEKEIERVLVERQQYEDEVLPVGTVVEKERADLVCRDASRQVKGRFINGVVEDEHEHDPGLKEREEITEEILLIRQRQLEEEERLIRERFERGEIISEEVIQKLRESRRRIQEEIEEYVLTTPTEIRVVYESEPVESDLPCEGDMEDVPVVLGKSKNVRKRFESLGDREELVIMHVPKDRVWKAVPARQPAKKHEVVKLEMIRSARVQVERPSGLSPHQFLPPHVPPTPLPRTEPPKKAVPVPEKPPTPPPEKKVVFTPKPTPSPAKKHKVVKVEMIRNARVQLEKPSGQSPHQFLPPRVPPTPPPRTEPPKVTFEEPTLVPAAEPRRVTVGPVAATKTVAKALVAEPVRGPKTVVTGPVVESRVVATGGRDVSTKREESRDVSIKRDETRKIFVGPAQVTTKVETVRGDPSVQRHVETGPVEEVREVITDPDGTKRTIIRRRVVKTTKTTTSTPVITKRVETKTHAVRSGVTRTAEQKVTMSSKKVTSSSGESVAKATKTITRQVSPGDETARSLFMGGGLSVNTGTPKPGTLRHNEDNNEDFG
uniref:Uncharacterized protein n=1 Tax=Branchiostoma floridae TaxID=7739 RepID=C3XSG9_BRAFL|eukprot:XP_002612881.1 hypothetical protein BRAFLDRAFT_127281 [Branchiostoma floridae]